MCGFGMANGTEFFALMKGTCAGAKVRKAHSHKLRLARQDRV